MNACNTPPTKGKSKLKYQKAKPNSKTEALKIFLNFDLGFALCSLIFAFCVTHDGLCITRYGLFSPRQKNNGR